MKTPVSYLEAKDRLSGEYLETFEHIESYCQTEFITEDDLEDRMGYLLDIFLSAQSDKVPVSAVTGESIKTFCKNFMSDCDIKSVFAYIADLLKRASWIAVVLVIIGVFFELLSGSKNIFSAMLQSTDIATCVILGAFFAMLTQVVSSLIIKGFIFKVKKYRSIYHKTVVNIVSIVLFGSMLFIGWNGFSLGVPDVFVFSGAIAYLIGYYIIKGINNKKQGKAFFFNESSRQKTSFSQKVLTAMVGEFRDMYAKENAKRAKKGKPEMTNDEFIQKLEKDNKTAKVSTIVCVASLAVIYIGNMIPMLLESTVTDALAYAVVLLAVLSLVYFLVMHSFVVYPYLSRKRFFEILKKSGKTVFDEDVYDCINEYYDE